MDFRKELDYPPFARLVHLRLDGPRSDEVEEKARRLARHLMSRKDQVQGKGIEILGPAPAPIQKLRNRYRWQILLKCKSSLPLRNLAEEGRAFCRAGRVRLRVDVDPYDML